MQQWEKMHEPGSINLNPFVSSQSKKSCLLSLVIYFDVKNSWEISTSRLIRVLSKLQTINLRWSDVINSISANPSRSRRTAITAVLAHQNRHLHENNVRSRIIECMQGKNHPLVFRRAESCTIFLEVDGMYIYIIFQSCVTQPKYLAN